VLDGRVVSVENNLNYSVAGSDFEINDTVSIDITLVDGALVASIS
jgi:hypothetical protein